MKENIRKRNQEDEIPTAEWVVAGVGLALVCAFLGMLFYKAFFVEKSAPMIDFQVERIVNQESGALVLAKATNRGGGTATGLRILARAGDETNEVTIDFLPAGSSRSFGVFFQKPPEAGSVEFEAGGYQEP